MVRPSFAALPAYVVGSILATWPLALHPGRVLPRIDTGNDALILTFILGWDWKALANDPAGIFRLPIFHPHPRALTFTDHLIGPAFLAWPLGILGLGPAAGFNALMLLAAAASAWTMYRLGRLLGLSRPGSFVAGWLFAFNSYRTSNLEALNVVQTQFLPLGIFFAIRFLARLRAIDLLGLSACGVVQVWFGWYPAYFLLIALGLLAVYQVAAGRISWKRLPLRAVGTAAVLSAVAVLPAVLPYWTQARLDREFRRTLGEAALFSADVLDYVKVDPLNRVLGGTGWLTGPQAYWPGLVMVVLAIAGFRWGLKGPLRPATPAGRPSPVSRGSDRGAGRSPVGRTITGIRSWARRWGDQGYFLALGITAFVLSLGPILHVAGRAFPVPLPFAALYYGLPGVSGLRAPGRFAILVLLALAVFAGLGYDAFRRALAGTSRARAGLFILTLGLAMVTGFSGPIPTLDFPGPESMPPVYRWLAEQPGRFAYLDYPLPVDEQDEKPRDSVRQIYHLYHGKIRLDGGSGYVPPDYVIFRGVIRGFPSSGAVRAASRQGAKYAIVHYADLAPATRDRVEREARESADLREAARFGEDVAYEILPGDSPP